MSGLAEVVERLRHAIEGLDRAAVGAARARADAEEARRRLAMAGRGSSSPVIRQAVVDVEAAGVAAGRASRLYAQAASRYASYLDHIALGSTLARPATDPLPSGERLVAEVVDRPTRRAEAAFRKYVQKADDTKDALKSTEDNVKAVYDYFRQQRPPTGATSASTVDSQPALTQERPHIDQPVAAVAMTAGAVAVIIKGVWKHLMKSHKRK